MDAAERAAAARAAGAASAEIAAVAEAVHAAVGRQVAALGRAAAVASGVPGLGEGAAGVPGAVARRVPGAAALGWYAAVRGAAPVAGSAVAVALRATTPQDATPWSHTPRGTAALAWLGAAFGDHLAAMPGTQALAPPMAVRVQGRAVAPPDLAAAFPDASPRVCLFLHGLGGHEAQWGREVLDSTAARGFTPVVLRYTSGVPIAENGRLLAVLLDALVRSWPTDVERLVLVGHSMGGLVARSAAAQAVDDDGRAMAWPALLTDLVTLGSPHSGAPLERVSHRSLQALRRWDPVRPFVRLGHRRSAGIKDLRFGALLHHHWGGLDPDEVGADRDSDATEPVPLPPWTRHVAVVGALAADPDGRVGRAVGDGLVPPASAAGRPGADERVLRVPLGRVAHLGLLADPRAVDVLADVLALRPVRGAAEVQDRRPAGR